MKFRNPLFIALIMLCVFAVSIANARNHQHNRKANDSSGRFDYYLMSLSWSPSYCATHPRDTVQCGQQGFGFVLHGLWPNYRNGGWPQHCSTQAAPDEATIKRTLAFMPSRHLIEHEWQTHGSCSGLDPSAYFQQADRAFASIKIPDALHAPRSAPTLSASELIQAFMQANPGLGKNMISIACHDGNDLTEVHICLNKDTLSPQACGGRIRNTCRIGALRIRGSR